MMTGKANYPPPTKAFHRNIKGRNGNNSNNYRKNWSVILILSSIVLLVIYLLYASYRITQNLVELEPFPQGGGGGGGGRGGLLEEEEEMFEVMKSRNEKAEKKLHEVAKSKWIEDEKRNKRVEAERRNNNRADMTKKDETSSSNNNIQQQKQQQTSKQTIENKTSNNNNKKSVQKTAQEKNNQQQKEKQRKKENQKKDDDDRPRRRAKPKNADFIFDKNSIPNAQIKTLTQEEEEQFKDQQSKHPNKDYILTAYYEETNHTEWEIQPLPTRTNDKKEPDFIKSQSFPQLNSCTNLPSQFPVDEEEAPTNKDPFLPWIHDVFPTADGKYIQFVAQNKRRCQSGTKMGSIKKYMEPNVALFQHVPVKRINVDGDDGNTKGEHNRYRLSTHEEADEDGIETRFICRFKPSMEETLSTFNVNYDYNTYRKGYRSTFTEEGFDVHIIWNSQLLFRCPVPESLQEDIRTGKSVVDDYASLFVDLIPIRTPPRFITPAHYLPPRFGMENRWNSTFYYGDNHILPLIEDSGRLENVPICKPSLMTYPEEEEIVSASIAKEKSKQKGGDDDEAKDAKALALIEKNDSKLAEMAVGGEKKHKLISCTWTSASFKTRGDRTHVSDGAQRLLQWLAFNKLVGVDHVYIYDNSGSFSDTDNLKPITDLFPGFVTRIDWPSRVCNNRPGNADNKGERSSQYAAESSCRLRFGAHSEWLASFDTDEYPVPVGSYNNLKDLLDDMDKEETHIVNFASKRSKPRVNHFDTKTVPDNCQDCLEPSLPINKTFLEAYNCNIEKPPRKNLMPAEKQIYRTDYVLLHFVHYSAITTLGQLSEAEVKEKNILWRKRYNDKHTRFTDELKEATMLHAKAIVASETRRWRQQSRLNTNHAKIGVPYPPGTEGTGVKVDMLGEKLTANCFPVETIDSYWVPKLREELSNLIGNGDQMTL